MIALGIIILILALLLMLPVGADAAFRDGVFSLKLKIGPLRLGLFPAGEKKSGEKKTKKGKKPKRRSGIAGGEEKSGTSKPGRKLSFDDIVGIIRLGLDCLGRFRRSISIDLLQLHLTAAGPDPYDAVMNYGCFNAALGALLPLIHRCFKVKREDYDSGVDFSAEKAIISARLVLSLRIGEILFIGLCAGVGFLRWLLRRRRRVRAEAVSAAKKENATEKSSAEKGT